MTEGPLWYKDSVFYELHVRGYSDGNGDGIGDFAGLTTKLPYIRDLGVDCIWLLPFFSSPLRDDGYDIADFMSVHPDYGTLDDFRRFLDKAHSMGLRVLADLVMNHTSDQHSWFKQARQDPASPFRGWYVWSDTPDRFRDTRIIFKDTETSNWTWDPVAKQYFWHRFFSHQPDLNFDNPAVRQAMLEVVAFWMNLGLDGFRVDAVPYLFEREGTNCENLPETHAFCKELRHFVDAQWPNRLLLAEANQWPQDLVSYFGNGSDEFQMAFHFPLMPRLFMGLRREEKKPVEEILQSLPYLKESCQWAIFLRNHDELTLEMVSDAERDYMYHEYATDPRMRLNLGIRRRLAPLLENGRRQIELLYGLLLSLPGSPVIYYGDELGMGDNIYLGDRNGVRTPMQWTMDRNAGFSQADAAQLYAPVIVDPVYSYHHLNVEAQNRVPTSLLNWVRRLIRIRGRHKLFGRGTLRLIPNSNSRVISFLRELGMQKMMVIANLSRFAQPCEMQLAALNGWTPREPFGNVIFPKIGNLPYFLTLGPHTFFWFELLPPEATRPQ
ncbi:MAG TPA: maltose alpha-D-glucosyltransferase [Candidatus Ozemobacteraceae bacterium]|nr:maltose alpha-D-glucosyltransferase [Candidatus Ozemobacteraceae bacterium]